MNQNAVNRTGLVVAATLATMVNMTAAVHAVFGTFLIPLTQAFGWQRASVSVVLGIISVTGAAIYPLAGHHVDSRGVKRLLIAGNIGLAVAVAALALSNGSLVRFYLTFAVIGVVGALTSSAFYSKLISDWFETRRGTMLGITGGVGNGVGATLMPVLAGLLLTTYGWRVAYLGVAAAVLLIGLPALVFGIRDAPRHRDVATPTAPGMTLREAARTPVFWVLLVSIVCGSGCLTAVFSHVVPILAERHVGLATATGVLGVFALVCAGWQIVVGAMLDRVASPRSLIPMYLLAVVGLAMVELGHGEAMLIGGGVCLGIGLGTQYGALPFLVARYFGLRAYGGITGTLYAVIVLFQGLTPILLDHAFDRQGSYRDALAVIGLCLAGGALLLAWLPSYRRGDAVLPVAVLAH